MGPVNWRAVVLAALAGLAVWALRRRSALRGGSVALAAVVMLLAATMMGHNFARVGVETLAGKPWLYWMMTGGFAIWFVAPALVLALADRGMPWRDRASEAAFWILAYLAMGTMFWGIG